MPPATLRSVIRLRCDAHYLQIAVDTGAPEDEPEVKAEEAAAGEVQDAPKTTKETRKSQRYPEGATPVMLGNLHWNTTDAEVETACKEYGKVLLLQVRCLAREHNSPWIPARQED